MRLISGHEIDPKQTEKLRPIPVRISFYVDGYAAKLSAATLYEIGDKLLYDHVKQITGGSQSDADRLYDELYAPPSPDVYAEILGYLLSVIELSVVSELEERLRSSGIPVLPNALLVNKSHPLQVHVDGSSGNLLEALYPVDEDEFCSDQFLDVSCEGIIYSPRKIDRQEEMSKLRLELRRSEGRDPSRAEWLKKNMSTLNDGVLHYRKNGKVGAPINFEFSEKFYDQMSDQIGFYSRLGENKVHWRKDLSDFGEKGVDCDLIMQVMDDLHKDRVDVFVFMTKDMDFFPLMERVQSEGKQVFLCGLKREVSGKLRETVGDESFFDMLDERITANLVTVFMARQKPELRSVALQWASLAMTRKRRGDG